MESFKNCGLNTSTGWKVLKISVLKANLPNRATGASIKQARVFEDAREHFFVHCFVDFHINLMQK